MQNRLLIYGIILNASLALFILGMLRIYRIGDFVAQWFPCVQDPRNSLPCQSHYDLVWLGFLAVVFVVAFGLFLREVIRRKKRNG